MEGMKPDTNENISNPEDLIRKSEDFDQLYEALKWLEKIRGTKKTYTSTEVIELIEMTRKVNGLITFIPRTYGIRDKVSTLLGIS